MHKISVGKRSSISVAAEDSRGAIIEILIRRKLVSQARPTSASGSASGLRDKEKSGPGNQHSWYRWKNQTTFAVETVSLRSGLASPD